MTFLRELCYENATVVYLRHYWSVNDLHAGY